jgi:hypothetical protein
LNARGYNIDFRAINNCALAKSTWENATGPIVTLRDDPINNNLIPQCDIQTTKENIVLYANTSPSYFCNTGPNGKLLEDFVKPNSRWSVGTSRNLPDNALFDKISKDIGNKIKVIPYELASNLAAAGKSGEIDFIISNGPWPEQQLGAKCFFVTGPYKVPGYANATDIWPNNEVLKLTYGYWFIAKGYTPEQMEKLRKDAKEIWSQSKDWTELRKKRGWNDSFVDLPLDQSVTLLDNNREIWNKYRQ